MAEILETLVRSSKAGGGKYRVRCPVCDDVYVTTGYPGELARRSRCIRCVGVSRRSCGARAARQRRYEAKLRAREA